MFYVEQLDFHVSLTRELLAALYQGAPEIVVRDLSQIEIAYMGFNYP
jgi:hypothetical protein